MPLVFPNSFGNLIVGSGYPLEVLADSPVGYWRLNDQGSGVGAMKTEVNSPTLDGDIGGTVPRVQGALSDDSTAFEYTGGSTSNSITGVGDDPLLDITGSLTIECFVNFTTDQGNKGIVSKWGGTNATRSYLLDVTIPNNKLAFGFQVTGGGGTFHFVTSDSTLNDGIWHHVVGVYDQSAGTLTMFVDNVAQVDQKTSITADIHVTTIDLEFGTFSNFPNGDVYTGFLDEVSLYDKALSTARIAAHFNAI